MHTFDTPARIRINVSLNVQICWSSFISYLGRSFSAKEPCLGRSFSAKETYTRTLHTYQHFKRVT